MGITKFIWFLGIYEPSCPFTKEFHVQQIDNVSQTIVLEHFIPISRTSSYFYIVTILSRKVLKLLFESKIIFVCFLSAIIFW